VSIMPRKPINCLCSYLLPHQGVHTHIHNRMTELREVTRYFSASGSTTSQGNSKGCSHSRQRSSSTTTYRQHRQPPFLLFLTAKRQTEQMVEASAFPGRATKVLNPPWAPGRFHPLLASAQVQLGTAPDFPRAPVLANERHSSH